MTEPGTGPRDAVAPSPNDPRIGSTLAGRYRIIAPLGEGGMGTVYRGVHEALRKPVAIKFLQQKINSNREMVARFEREAVTAANLRHPNIAEAIDYGSLPDGTLYLVMELVDGVSLRKLIPPGQGLPVERVLRILEQIATALDLAHSMGIVHRDLKPENILVFDRGTERDIVKIIDFGIARINSEIFKTGPTALTAAGAVFGTPQYMAPEQVMGQTADGRADQYAIGIIAFEMLTGSQPFTSVNYAELVMKHVGAPIPRSVELAPHVPAAFDAAIYRMMSKLPDERFATVTEALRAMKGETPSQSLPADSIHKSSNTVVMHATNMPATTGSDTHSLAFAATVAPGEQLPLPTRSPSPPYPTASAMREDIARISGANAAPAQTMQPPMDTSAQPRAAATSARASSKPPFVMIAVIGSFLFVVCLAIVFFVFRSQDSANDTRASADDATPREDKASGSSRAMATSSNTRTPSSTTGLSSTRRAAPTSKYRLLLKDGKYPFCVTSKLKNAYPVRTDEEGVKVCNGTPEGPIPIDGLEPYQPSEFQWE
ncbi:MAG: serine/threonine protein kinase [Polyangiaceae bacterium]|nr:serine/threonine protein kinase [Polyangiaceae bacterium]